MFSTISEVNYLYAIENRANSVIVLKVGLRRWHNVRLKGTERLTLSLTVH